MFKKLSWKITFIISATAIIVGTIIAVYMQFRIISEIDKHTTMGLQQHVLKFQLDVATDDSIDHIEHLMDGFTVYETGFGLVQDGNGLYVEGNEAGQKLGKADKDTLTASAHTADGDVFRIKLGGVDYMVAAGELPSDYTIYVLAPMREVNADLYASLMRFVVIFIFAFILVVIISYHVAKPISTPLIAVSKILRKVAATGNLRLSQSDTDTIEKLSKLKDESGRIVEDAAAFIDHVIGISETLSLLANGDLTHEVELKSDSDTMGLALKHMFTNLNDTFAEINATAAKVSSESKSLNDSAQSLAQGSVEQAASVEQLSSSIEDIADKTHENAEIANKAALLSDSIRTSAEKGSRQMNDMMTAVNEINEASKSISKIIKTIDDIAFQTNILALNAAVEAARAGQHGKGFAVVAEEVRNLASKSAEAAKDTGTMIQDSIRKAEYGSGIAGDTAASLSEIVTGINETTQLVSEIAKATEEQSQGISQINVGIDQVAQVVQLNSSTAQASVGVSEQMNEQSVVLEKMIAQFKLSNANRTNLSLESHNIS